MTQLLTFLFFIFTKKKITKPCKWVGWQNKKKKYHFSLQSRKFCLVKYGEG
jgi:hypothetical protein